MSWPKIKFFQNGAQSSSKLALSAPFWYIYIESENAEIAPKTSNPANAPEVRPIEDFWTEIKRIVYDGAWEANNLEQLRNRINYAFKKVDMKRVHALGNASFTRVDTVRRHGLQNL